MEHVNFIKFAEVIDFTGLKVDIIFVGESEWKSALVLGMSNPTTVYNVTYDDKTTEDAVTSNRIRLISTAAAKVVVIFKVGDIVESNYKGHGTYYPGKILKVNENDTFDVVYDDNEIEFHVPHTSIKFLGKLDQYNLVVKTIRNVLLEKCHGNTSGAFNLTKKIFSALDTDRSGELDLKEIKAFLNSEELAGLKSSQLVNLDHYYDMLVEQIDTDRLAFNLSLDVLMLS
jgi:hypothetical protein